MIRERKREANAFQVRRGKQKLKEKQLRKEYLEKEKKEHDSRNLTNRRKRQKRGYPRRNVRGKMIGKQRENMETKDT